MRNTGFHQKHYTGIVIVVITFTGETDSLCTQGDFIYHNEYNTKLSAHSHFIKELLAMQFVWKNNMQKRVQCEALKAWGAEFHVSSPKCLVKMTWPSPIFFTIGTLIELCEAKWMVYVSLLWRYRSLKCGRKFHFGENGSRSKCNIADPMEPTVFSFIPF